MTQSANLGMGQNSISTQYKLNKIAKPHQTKKNYTSEVRTQAAPTHFHFPSNPIQIIFVICGSNP